MPAVRTVSTCCTSGAVVYASRPSVAATDRPHPRFFLDPGAGDEPGLGRSDAGGAAAKLAHRIGGLDSHLGVSDRPASV